MHFRFEFHISYLPVMVNEEKKLWKCCFETTKRKAEEKARDMRSIYKKEDGWKVPVQKRTFLKVNGWEKEWVDKFYDKPCEWYWALHNPSTDFIRRNIEFIQFGL